MKPIILLGGPIGAGKTTVAKELVAITKGPVAGIEGDHFWQFIAKSEGIGMKENFQLIMRSMMVSAIPFTNAGYEVILDFSFPPHFIPTALKLAQMRQVPVDFVVIRPDLELCAERAATRAEGKITDYKPYERLYREYDEVRQYTIYDNTGDAAAIAAKIRESLDKGMFRISN